MSKTAKTNHPQTKKKKNAQILFRNKTYKPKNQLKDLKVVAPGKGQLSGRMSGDCYLSYVPHSDLLNII